MREDEVQRHQLSDDGVPLRRTTVAIVTHRFWEEKLASNTSALGTTLTLDNTAFEVIGVLPKSFAWGPPTLDLLVPLAPDPARGRGDHRLLVIGRLRPGVSLRQAQSEIVLAEVEGMAAPTITKEEAAAPDVVPAKPARKGKK